MKHFLSVTDLDADSLASLLARATELKAGAKSAALVDRSVGMIFEKPSTRTRVSFEVAIKQLGGHPVVLQGAELQLGRGETIADTAKTLSRYLDALVVRTFEQDRLQTLADAGSIPVVNALSDHEHPCQAVADLLTMKERLKDLSGAVCAYVGDGNNVVHSLLLAGALAQMEIRCITPPGYEPDAGVVTQASDLAKLCGGPQPVVSTDTQDVAGAQVLYTDVWASMGQESQEQERLKAFADYSIDAELVAKAGDPLVMHCLPAHRGQEIAAEVIDGDRSIVWDQAENRLHAQKAILECLLS